MEGAASAVSNMERLLWARQAMEAAATACNSSSKQEPRALQSELRAIVGLDRLVAKIMPTLTEDADVDDDVEEIRDLIRDELSLNARLLLAELLHVFSPLTSCSSSPRWLLARLLPPGLLPVVSPLASSPSSPPLPLPLLPPAPSFPCFPPLPPLTYSPLSLIYPPPRP